MINRIKNFFRILGPGFISGAADNDPAGIATYTQVGAQFGYGQLWTAVFALPLLIAVQEACARIGAVTGKGLAKVIQEHYSKKILYLSVFILLITNTINIGADIGAMAGALRLIIPVSFIVLVLGFVFIILILEIFTTYKVYARYLKWLSGIAFLYLLTVFLVEEPWGQILHATFVPHFELTFAFFLIVTGNIGTTIAPYLFFWEASEEVEEIKQNHLVRRNGIVSLSEKFIAKLRVDNAIGMFASQIITWSIIVVSATVLHSHGITDIKTAADAAHALEPLVHTFPHAGFVAKTLFAVGIVGAGLLVVPILSGSVAYAISEAVNWKEGLNLKLEKAHGFYGIITLATVIGLVINFIGIDPIKLLVYTSVLNGIAAVPLIFLIGHISHSDKIMGTHKGGAFSHVFIWLAFVVMALCALGMFVTVGK